ncbi:DUF4390 domain-containing protein [Ideonella sp.]|uniref:DUF4390 domain-containing protein n=1 Tax=Ideonella sp. TaxID=1929293 RepID=UPI0037BF9E95
MNRLAALLAVTTRPARGLAAAMGAWCLALFLLLPSAAAQAQSMELPTLSLERQEGALVLSFVAKPALSKAVEEALQRGVPVYFVAEAQVNRVRWYWRNERITRASRTWRLSYQPLTSSWRVSFGALSQNFPSLTEALATVTRATDWKIADPEQLDLGERYEVEFSYRLDADQLPRPMQLDLAAQADWRLAIGRKLKIDY